MAVCLCSLGFLCLSSVLFALLLTDGGASVSCHIHLWYFLFDSSCFIRVCGLSLFLYCSQGGPYFLLARSRGHPASLLDEGSVQRCRQMRGLVRFFLFRSRDLPKHSVVYFSPASLVAATIAVSVGKSTVKNEAPSSSLRCADLQQLGHRLDYVQRGVPLALHPSLCVDLTLLEIMPWRSCEDAPDGALSSLLPACLRSCPPRETPHLSLGLGACRSTRLSNRHTTFSMCAIGPSAFSGAL